MNRLVLIVFVLTLVLHLAAGQNLLVETCPVSFCGNTCFGCSNASWVNNTDSNTPLVICPQNDTFCYVDYYWSNGTWSVQNCSSCANSSNTSCTSCQWMNNSFVQNWCSPNGTCWSMNYTNSKTNGTNNTNNNTDGSSLWVETCSASSCGSSCLNCSNATWINNTNTNSPMVLCPQNGTFCFVDYYWSNGSWSLQNCSGCWNSSNTSCTDCSWVNNSFQQDYCATNGTCWSIMFNNTNMTNATNSTNNTNNINGGGPSLGCQTCPASVCGTSCRNCPNSTWLNNTNISTPLVVCPQSGTFCFVGYFWSNGTWSCQNCSSCAGSSNTSCTGCFWVTDSFVQDWCSPNGTCWSIIYNNTVSTNWTIDVNSTSNNGTNTTTTVIWSSSCRCATNNTIGTDALGKLCSCPLVKANTTTYPNGTSVTTVKSQTVNTSLTVASGIYLQVSLFMMIIAAFACSLLP